MNWHMFEDEWDDADDELKISDVKIQVASGKDWVPKRDERIGAIRLKKDRGTKREVADTEDDETFDEYFCMQEGDDPADIPTDFELVTESEAKSMAAEASGNAIADDMVADDETSANESSIDAETEPDADAEVFETDETVKLSDDADTDETAKLDDADVDETTEISESDETAKLDDSETDSDADGSDDSDDSSEDSDADADADEEPKETDYVIVNGEQHKVYEEKGGIHRVFWKFCGYARVADEDGNIRYVLVEKRRKAAIILLFLLALLIGSIIFWSLTGVKPTDQPVYVMDSTGITQNNKDAKATIDYASYQSTPDQTWKAGTTTQDCTLILPKDVYTKDTSGNEVKHDNPVMAAPHIYVDLNADGEFTEDECVFNPQTFDDDGNVSDYGAMLEPGHQIDQIELTQALSAGTYSAKTVWTGITTADHAVANPMTFQWNLTVE